jgi:hypothetical protein
VHDPSMPGHQRALQAYGQQEGGEEVDLPGRLVAVLGALAARRRRVVADAGVVDQTRQRPEAPGDLVDKSADLREGGEIGGNDLTTADTLDRRRRPLVAAPVHDHARAPL